MKKKLLLLFIIIGSFTSQAQSNFKIGLHAGINYPDVRGYENAKYHNFKAGFLIGASFDYYLNEKFSLKTNINYEKKIQEYRITFFSYYGGIESGKQDFNREIALLNIPVLLKYEFWNSNFFVNAGPFINFVLSDKTDSEYLQYGNRPALESNKIDTGVSFGLGTNISLTNKHELTIEIRDDLGLIDTRGDSEYYNDALKSNMIKLMIGWNLGI
ncbi:porin family protein [Bizionia myxarmorum]|uniref:PorT family protein n=1 Tax=Bizionia myxarmorum TaxID=291186 RepID=A0A5D0R737_9FLAO|nr:porin family protein [Bizionia myxarmorum]TYB76909.1 PorT family protein [Bizionia myxarmorum]